MLYNCVCVQMSGAGEFTFKSLVSLTSISCPGHKSLGVKLGTGTQIIPRIAG